MNGSPNLTASCLAGLVLGAACSAPTDADDAPDPERWREIKQEIRTRFDDVKHVTIEEFERTRTPDILLVDVRTPEEYEVSRIAGARNAPVDGGVAAALADQPEDRRIVVYCSVGWRSSEAAQQLERAGFTDVVNLEGSIFEWANAGHPVVDDDGVTDVVHGYNSSWSQLLRPELRAKL